MSRTANNCQNEQWYPVWRQSCNRMSFCTIAICRFSAQWWLQQHSYNLCAPFWVLRDLIIYATQSFPCQDCNYWQNRYILLLKINLTTGISLQFPGTFGFVILTVCLQSNDSQFLACFTSHIIPNGQKTLPWEAKKASPMPWFVNLVSYAELSLGAHNVVVWRLLHL